MIVADIEGGHWEYRSDDLSILINEIKTTNSKGPLVYYVAHVRMKSDQYRSAFGNEGRTGRTSEAPWKLARRYRAVLLITGDNMLNMDTEKKGILIRDGRVYQKTPRTEMMSWDPVTLTLGIQMKNTVTVQDYLEHGIDDVHSFGPWLIHEGTVNTKLNRSPLYTLNPRTGVGMIEPGHLVVIVCDGRQSDRSIGMDLDQFAQLFVDEGCTEAYNLDGGVSAAMVFMGEQLNTHLNIENASRQRNLPDGLMWGYTEQCPTLSDPIYNDGIRNNGSLTLRKK